MNRLVALTLVAATACASLTASARRDDRLRAELDAHRFPQPLAQVWPVALRLLAAHGCQLVGTDRKVAGQAPVGFMKRITAGGVETGLHGEGLAMETMEDRDRVRYRMEGTDLGPTCQVRIWAIRRTGGSPSEERSRALDLELELVRRLEPDEAARMARVAEGG